MVKGMLSIVIPDRNGQPYLQLTIDDILKKAEGEIEIIVVCDGTWPVPFLKDDPHVKIIHHGTVHNNLGMREGINRGIAISSGEYIMKTDEHTMFDQGFDRKLKEDCEDNWVVIPRRYRLMADETPWRLEEYLIQEDGSIIPDPAVSRVRPPVDYMFISYPYERPYDKTCGLHGAEDRQRHYDRKDILIDETMTMQGSCYFMKRSYWDFLFSDGLDSENYGTFTQEAQEISNAAWLSGGQVMVNKKTWYAHMHKGKRGKGYGFSNEQYAKHQEGTERGRVFCIDYWMNDKHLVDSRFKYAFECLLNRFGPVPTWPQNWKEQIKIDEVKDYSRLRVENKEI